MSLLSFWICAFGVWLSLLAIWMCMVGKPRLRIDELFQVDKPKKSES